MLVVFATELMPDEYTSEEKINRMIEGFPERAIVVAHGSDLFNPYGLSIEWVRDIAESLPPELHCFDGTKFLSADHEACWAFMLQSSPRDLAADFGRQVQDRRTLDNWAFGDE